MIPLQASPDIVPEFLTTPLAIVLLVLIFSMLYGTIKLRSMFGMFGWLCMLIAFVFAIVSNFGFIWFWIMVVVEGFVLVFASLEYARVSART